MADGYGASAAADGYRDETNAAPVDEDQPRILLMGLKRSGKTSIQKVVFQKVSPHETVLLETSTKMQKSDISNNSFVQFQIWDFPGQLMDLFDEEDGDMDWDKVFAGHGAIVYVIDCADKWPPAEAVKRLSQTIVRVITTPGNNKPKSFEIFIHKVDCLKLEQSQEKHLDVKRFVEEELNIEIRDRSKTDPKLAEFDIRSFLATAVHYHMTSIYDHSVFDAFSKVVQRVIGHMHDCITALLGMLVTRCGMEKAYLFDVLSKIYVAQDEGVTAQMYEVCFDMIDVAIDISAVYGCQQQRISGDPDDSEQEEHPSSASPADPSGSSVMACEDGAAGVFPFDSQSCAVIRLDSKQVLFLHEVNKYLALVCLVREEAFKKIGLINYNVMQFKKLIHEMFEVQKEKKKAAVK